MIDEFTMLGIHIIYTHINLLLVAGIDPIGAVLLKGAKGLAGVNRNMLGGRALRIVQNNLLHIASRTLGNDFLRARFN